MSQEGKKNIIFRRRGGGEINIVFGPKYRPLGWLQVRHRNPYPNFYLPEEQYKNNILFCYSKSTN
jgi:hypothetical protein